MPKIITFVGHNQIWQLEIKIYKITKYEIFSIKFRTFARPGICIKGNRKQTFFQHSGEFSF